MFPRQPSQRRSASRRSARPPRRRAASAGPLAPIARGTYSAESVTLGDEPGRAPEVEQRSSTSSARATRGSSCGRGRDLAREPRVPDERGRGSRRACGRRSRGGATRARTASPPGRARPRARPRRAPASISGSTSSRLSSGGRAEQEPAAAELPVRRRDRRRLGRRLDPRRHRRPAARGVEERQLVRPEAEHRHAERLEQLGRRGHVEQRLHARRDDERRRPRERLEVGRDVRRRRPAAVHAAEPAGAP